MSNISGQLIKDSYNYVLQSDLISGIVYRIGGSVAENPKFISGLTVNANFTYSDGTEFPGYVLTCDASGNAVWSPVSGATSGVVVTGGTFDYSAGTLTLVLSNGVDVPISGLEDIYVTGGTVSGTSIVFSYNDINTFQVTGITPYNLFSSYTASTQSTINNKLDTSGFTAYTATTQPLILNSVTGGTFSGGTLYLINNSGSTIPISGFTTGGTSTTDTFVTGFTLSANTITLSQNRTDSYSSFTISLSAYTGSSVSGEYLPLSGGTVTGGTIFQSGLTANTISATTYYNLPKDVFVTGGTYTSGNVIFTNNTGGTFIVTGFAIGGGGSQPFYLNLSQSKNGNRYLSTTASTAAEQSTGVTIANGVTSTIASFQSDQLNITLIPDGIWSFYLHSYKQNNNASFNIFVEVYKRTSGGTETLLFTTDPAPVTTNSPNPSMQLSDAYFSGTPLLVSDSIVARVRATNTSNQSHVITLFSEGSQHYSYAVSTLQTQQGLTCDTLSGCSIIQTIQGDITTIQGDITTIQGDITTIQGEIIGTPQQIAYYNVDGKLTGDTGFTRQDEISNFATQINTVDFINIALHQETIFDGTRIRDRVFNDDVALVGMTRLDSDSFVAQIDNTAALTTSGLEILESSGSFKYTTSAGNYNGFFYNDVNPGWYVFTGKNQKTYNLPTSGYITGSVLTDVNGDGNLTWEVPTPPTITGGTVTGPTNFTDGLTANIISATTYQNLPSFTGGTVSGATRFISGLTANTISATTYQNLPATPFLPLTGGTVSGFVRIQPTPATNEKALFSISENSSESIALYGLAGKGTNAYGVYCDVSPAAEFYTITNGIGGYFEVGGQFSEGEPTNKYSLQLKDGTQGVGKVLTSVTSDGKANWETPKTNGSNLYLFYNY